MLRGTPIPFALTALVCLTTSFACNDDVGNSQEDPDTESGDGDGDGDGDGESFPCPRQFVPTNQADLLAWLETGEYQSWTGESEVHTSTGPHFGGVRTFVDACLGGSLNASETERPSGSAAVKELYGDGEEIRGWSVMAKIASGSGADTWYWFEIYDDTVYGDDIGLELCSDCHSGGDDFFLSPWPLQ